MLAHATVVMHRHILNNTFLCLHFWWLLIIIQFGRISLNVEKHAWHCSCGITEMYFFQLWKYSTTGPIFSSPSVWTNASCDSVTNQNIVVGSHDHHVYCVSDTGDLRWMFKADSEVYATPCLFSIHQYGKKNRSNTIQHVAQVQVDVPFQRQTLAPPEGQCDSQIVVPPAGQCDSQIVVPPAGQCDSQTLVAVCSCRGYMYILDATCGRELGRHELPGDTFSSPVVINNTVIVGCRDDYVYALHIQHVTWQKSQQGCRTVTRKYDRHKEEWQSQ